MLLNKFSLKFQSTLSAFRLTRKFVFYARRWTVTDTISLHIKLNDRLLNVIVPYDNVCQFFFLFISIQNEFPFFLLSYCAYRLDTHQLNLIPSFTPNDLLIFFHSRRFFLLNAIFHTRFPFVPEEWWENLFTTSFEKRLFKQQSWALQAD